MIRVAITGSEGLIGRSLRAALACRGVEVCRIDIRLPAGEPGRIELGDPGAAEAMHQCLAGCQGVVHLAAVSRVVWGERDPRRCQITNVEGTRQVVRAAAACPSGARPWVLLASSREVYGDAAHIPVAEDAPLQPLNAYARSKVAAEEIVLAARSLLRTAVIRLSSVYGCPADHPDRVVPAFARGAARGGTLRVEGRDHVLDLTHVEDVAEGLCRAMDLLDSADSAQVPVLHLVSGVAITLGQLAGLASALGGGRARLVEAPPRTYDVSRFVGDPRRAQALLGWRATTPLSIGVARLVRQFQASAPQEGARP
jgi:nucleoside-diphosphate-sugar epimerase